MSVVECMSGWACVLVCGLLDTNIKDIVHRTGIKGIVHCTGILVFLVFMFSQEIYQEISSRNILN